MQEGELAAILGSSGGGKTSLFRCLLGELRPMAGEILIDGQDVARLPTERRGIRGVYQSFAPFPHLPVAENIGYGLRAPPILAQEPPAPGPGKVELGHPPGKERPVPR